MESSCLGMVLETSDLALRRVVSVGGHPKWRDTYIQINAIAL